MRSITQGHIKIFFQMAVIATLIFLFGMQFLVTEAAPRDDACNGSAVGQSCSYSSSAKTGSDTVEGICARGFNGGLFCGNSSEWRNCSSHPSAVGDACQVGNQTGQCQQVDRSSGGRQAGSGVVECVTAASVGNQDGTDLGGDDEGGTDLGGEDEGGTDLSGDEDNNGGSGNGNNTPQPQPQSVQFNNPITATSIPELIATIIRGVLGLLGAVAVAIIVYAGFTYMTAGGNSSKTAQATTAITNAVIGLVVIMGAFLIVDYVISAIVG